MVMNGKLSMRRAAMALSTSVVTANEAALLPESVADRCPRCRVRARPIASESPSFAAFVCPSRHDDRDFLFVVRRHGTIPPT